MLKKLRISNFKSIAESRLDFGKANLIIGPNGAGKSNLLEALGVLSAALSRGLDPTYLDTRGVRLSLPHLFKSAFKNRDLPATFRLDAQFEHGKYVCSIRASEQRTTLEFHSEALFDEGRQIFGRSPHGVRIHTKSHDVPVFENDMVDPERSVWDIIGPFCHISENFRRELDEFTSYAIYSPQTAVMRGLAIDNRVIEPLGLTGSRLAAAFQEALTGTRHHSFADLQKILQIIWESGWADTIHIRAFDPNVVPPQVRSEGKLLYIRDKFMKTNRNLLSPFDASEGTLYLVFVATLLAHPRTPRAFALDNVDGTLNPELVQKLTDHLVAVCTGERTQLSAGEATPYQAFMTSHHPSSLDSFDIFRDDQAVFVANRDTSPAAVIGSTRYTQLRPPKGIGADRWRAINGDRNLSTMFVEGMIPGAKQ